MVKIVGRRSFDEFLPDPTPSLAKEDPWADLGVGVVVKAIDDLNEVDTLKSLDALLWFLSPDALMFLDALGFPLTSPDENLLSCLCLEGCKVGRKRRETHNTVS